MKVKCLNFGKYHTWSHKQLEGKTYVGENAFGVKRIISYKEYENIFIETEKIKPDFYLENVPPQEAMKLVPNLRFLVIGEPLQPFVKTATALYKPTLDNPEEVKGYNYSLIVEMKEIWLYNFETGKILSKRKIEE